MFVGDGRTTTIITANRNVVDGSTTFNSATVAVVGDGFLARDITFQNTAGPSKHQAVALRVNADLCAFYRCDMLAYQDTLYVHSLRQFYTGCIIAGTVDFIFGNAAAVLQNCDIHARRPNPGQRNMVTAQGRDDPNQNTGIVIQKCRIAHLRSEAGAEQFPDLPRQALEGVFQDHRHADRYKQCHQPGRMVRVEWEFRTEHVVLRRVSEHGRRGRNVEQGDLEGFRVLTSAAEAQPFTAGRFIAGGNWLGATGFPFSLGL
ncbi:UNVERIFIED_CONTAM: Pectinesterase/pectinesterase inhibitor 3 [Sesamum latifolium]|uniref:Pectinesterase n=1 Tax=Sesamum latifolium TaxID=2727402 RepID=A0AAW2VEH5_9LAMI